ncbi:ribonuclease H2 subunit A, partial [Pezoporus occidentalis]|uniref:ribonuclease H2 subunit A n=1 Tax=Pezoporus occidentalis TaxID=407982 RepID=UPI002F914C9E
SKYNLNELSHDTAMGLVQFALDSGVRVAELLVDTVGPAEPYAAKLRLRFPGLGVTVCPRADSSFPVVSAASICAKDLHQDPKTKEWLRRSLEPVFGFPQLVRFSWGTAKELLRGGGVPVTWVDEDPESDPTAPPSLLSYFARTPPQGRPPHRFFQERRLHPMDDL